jgi:hypothetical protein
MSKEIKLLHEEKRLLIVITLLVLKLDKFTKVKKEHKANILFIFIKFLVLKFNKLIYVNLVQE